MTMNITTVMGNCGVGFAPCKPQQREMLIKVMEGVEDISEIVLELIGQATGSRA